MNGAGLRGQATGVGPWRPVGRHLWPTVIPMLLVLALTLGSACGVAFDEMSGEDAKRGGATQIALNAPIDDRVDAATGDNTDWKAFVLDEAAEATLRVWWDSPGLEATVVVRNPEARSEIAETHRPGSRRDVIGPVQLPAGTYFVQVQATEGASVYTLEVLASDAGAGGSGGARPGF